MKKATIIYASLISTVGIALGLWSSYLYFSSFSGSVFRLVVLAFILVLCRSLPLFVREDVSIEMSFISFMTILILEGPFAACALCLITTPLRVEPMPGKDGGFSHIFNTPFIKTAFNTGMLIISLYVSGLCYIALGGLEAGTSLPECLLPVFAHIVVSMVINTLLMSILQRIEAGLNIFRTLVQGFGQFLPNILLAAPLGYFFAVLFLMKSGTYLAILFLCPLLLARYSFKLYLDTKQQQYKVINALSAAIEAKDIYTVGHSKRVEEYSELIARQLRLSAKRIETIKIAALFHDIGKIGVKDNILNKPGSLTNDERTEINRHPGISVHILEDIDFYGDIKDIILAHHERYDGSGYPNGKSGKDIPLEASIIAVADAFDAMTSDRPYRKGFTVEKALSIIDEEAGKQFNPACASALLTLHKQGRLEDLGAEAN